MGLAVDQVEELKAQMRKESIKYKQLLLDQHERFEAKQTKTDERLLKQEAKTKKLLVDQETRYDKLMLQILAIQQSLPTTQIYPSSPQQNNVTVMICCNAWCEIPTSCLKSGKHKRECDRCLTRHKK
jgi:hypothetical protein